MNCQLKTCLSFLLVFVTASLIVSSVYLTMYMPSSRGKMASALKWANPLSRLEDRYRKEMEMDDGECSCQSASEGQRNYVGLPVHSRGKRGNLDRDEWESEQRLQRAPIVVCPALSPLEYVGGGITVEPKKSVRLVGLSVHESVVTSPPASKDDDKEIVMTFSTLKGFGTIFIEVPSFYRDFVTIENNLQQKATMRVKRDHALLTVMLKQVQYHSTYYDINHRDTVEVRLLDYVVHIHVHIQRKNPPRLYDPGPTNHISWLLTVVTATKNIKNVEQLVDTVRKFYSNITIVVADYSSERQKINMTNVKQYFLPKKYNEFSALSLAISQVRTKLFLLVKDNYVFTERTKLELLVEKLEDMRERLDVVGGFFEDAEGKIVDGERFYKRLESESGSIDGDCVHLKYGGYRKLDNYPQCTMVDAVEHFFAGKTIPWWGLGLDSDIQPLGLDSVFVEALGRLRIATCTDVTIHNPNVAQKTVHHSNLVLQTSADRLLFKSNLQCFNI
ncbi:beta-1,4 N-acetylgalactosaminyltransferase 2-like [Ptychodera flava]|uniref:beta-1,4 N-acetylgalactosaminyltransferase 2-like n=1 Tax=Ptychodera flava TaxID=63121 RepID=UPI00396AAA1E